MTTTTTTKKLTLDALVYEWTTGAVTPWREGKRYLHISRDDFEHLACHTKGRPDKTA